MKPNSFLSPLLWGVQWVALASLAALLSGCTSTISAVNLNPESHEKSGIPFYLPRAYLVVTKNVRYIPTPTVGLTETAPIPNSFQNESSGSGGTNTDKGGGSTNGPSASAKPAAGAGASTNKAAGVTPQGAAISDAKTGGTGNSNSAPATASSQLFGPPTIVTVPQEAPEDGLIPETFYTYQILYLPDLTQKYGLRIHGRSGELRATENLVNGWMHTGPGPLYLGNSSTAASIAAAGTALGSVAESVGKILLPTPSLGTAAASSSKTTPQGLPLPSNLSNYAEIYVYEQVLDKMSGRIEFALVASNVFGRQYVGLKQTSAASNGRSNNENQSDPALSKATNDVTQGLLIPSGSGSFKASNTQINGTAMNITLTFSGTPPPMASRLTLAQLESQVTQNARDILNKNDDLEVANQLMTIAVANEKDPAITGNLKQ